MDPPVTTMPELVKNLNRSKKKSSQEVAEGHYLGFKTKMQMTRSINVSKGSLILKIERGQMSNRSNDTKISKRRPVVSDYQVHLKY